MNKTIAASAVLLLLMCMVTASASNAGSSSEPLVTLSYLEGTYTTTLKTHISQMLGNAEKNASNMLYDLYGQFAGYSFASSYTQFTLYEGDTVILPMGGSFVLLTGSATLTAANGIVVDVSSGQEVAAGTQLLQNSRIFSTEDTVATITICELSAGQVDGYYWINTTDPNKSHPIFLDVMLKDWYYQPVDFVHSNGLFHGTAENIFSPSVSMTRAMFVTVLHRMDGQTAANASEQFADVLDTESYYYNAVAWASENNIVQGYSDGTFRPNTPISREQIATVMHRYAEFSIGDVSILSFDYDAFPDLGDVSAYALEALRWAVSQSIINGSNGYLLPRSIATRAQVAQVIYNYFTLLK